MIIPTAYHMVCIHIPLTKTSLFCLIILAAFTLIKYMILEAEKRSYNIYNLLVVTNLATGLALLVRLKRDYRKCWDQKKYKPQR